MRHRLLPVEIWGIIFGFATACPEEWEFGTREHYGTFWPEPFGLNITIRRWKDALKTRRSLIAVSRFFNQLTIPLLYQSFFAIQSRQISHFRLALQTRPALGEYIKRLGFFAQPDPYPHTEYLPILRCCPNVVFYNAELRPSGLKPAPSLRSLELIYTPEFDDKPTAPAFLYLLAGILQATPQLEHLGLYHLPVRIKVTNCQPFVSIRLEYLRTLHLRAHSPYIYLPGTTLTVPLFSSLTLPRLEELLLDVGECDEGVLSGIPVLWLQQIHQFNVTHVSIALCTLERSHFHRLRKFILDFSSTSDDTRGKLHEKLPFIQLEEIELVSCTTPIDLRSDAAFQALYLVFCLCADDTATPKLRSLSTDIIGLERRRRFMSPRIIEERLNELQSVVNRVLVRGIEPRGLASSSLRSIIQKLIRNTETWIDDGTDDGFMTEWVSSCSEDEDDSWGSDD